MLNKDLLKSCAIKLIEKKCALAFAESATAGRVAAEFSMLPDAGRFLKGALVCYDASLKENILHVPKAIIEKYTPESLEVTTGIAIGLKSIITADLYIGITGLTAPGGSESEQKPVGTMFIAGYGGETVIFAHRAFFSGNPEAIVLDTVNQVAALILQYIDAV